MYRKSLETAMKLAFPKHPETLSLYQRIEKAKDDGGLTKELAGWAHEIRGLGNEAIHEEQPFSRRDSPPLAISRHPKNSP